MRFSQATLLSVTQSTVSKYSSNDNTINYYNYIIMQNFSRSHCWLGNV